MASTLLSLRGHVSEASRVAVSLKRCRLHYVIKQDEALASMGL